MINGILFDGKRILNSNSTFFGLEKNIMSADLINFQINRTKSIHIVLLSVLNLK